MTRPAHLLPTTIIQYNIIVQYYSLHRSLLYITVLGSIVLYWTVLYSTILYCPFVMLLYTSYCSFTVTSYGDHYNNDTYEVICPFSEVI